MSSSRAIMLVFSLLSSSSLTLGGPVSLQNRDSAMSLSLDHYIIAERTFSMKYLLPNIGGDAGGSAVPNASAGVVVASPSTVNPDYFYTWVRDAALTIKCLVDSYVAGDGPNNGDKIVEEYISSQARLQALSNPSGTLQDGSGLGEPKFYTNETAFLGEWGRPQRDGPALRATAMMAWGRWLIANNDGDRVKTDLWPVIRNDLAYVGQYWNQTGFDLWEEEKGSSFFTTSAQHRALVEGADFATSINQKCEACTVAPQLRCLLSSYWNGQYIVSNTNLQTKRTGKDANSLLASIQAFDPAATNCNDSATSFQPCSPKALANHKAVVDSFRPASLYPINANLSTFASVALGRYAEDTYYAGNPWYLTTLAAAEFLYSALHQFSTRGSITITPLSYPFFRDHNSTDVPIAPNATYIADSPEYKDLTTNLWAYADGFMAVVQKYTPDNGSLAEQFAKSDGIPLSARDLTWSYAAFLTASARRQGKMPASWGADNARDLPRTCAGTTVRGTYKAVVFNVTQS